MREISGIFFTFSFISLFIVSFHKFEFKNLRKLHDFGLGLSFDMSFIAKHAQQ